MGMFKRLFLVSVLLLAAGAAGAVSTPAGLIPAPVSYTVEKGVFRGGPVRETIGGKAFSRAVRELPPFAREEAYRLTVTRRGVRIEALTPTGAFRARQTLEMLRSQEGTIACCTVFDYPRFPYRGLMIDESRTFKGKDFLLKQIDAMALLKLNVLHLHLTDAAGWRIEIRSCPSLTEKVAWRLGDTYAEWEAAGYPFSTAGNPGAYGGFYTQEDLKEIVAYAAERCITVIPEIEMPGHSMEVNRALPELACVDGEGRRRTFAWDLCPGNEGTFRFLQAVLDEVMEIFPSELIHIGGDEAVMKDWPECVHCRARMQEEGFTACPQLQGYLMRRIAAYLASHGRRAVGWDEIVTGGLPEGAVVMSWRGVEGGREAADAGHDVVMSPTAYCYLNYYQDLIRKEPKATGELISLRRCYSFNPVPEGVDPARVLGLQGNLWCELVQTPEQAEYMLYPRAFAIAETGWSPSKDWPGFRERACRLADLFHRRGYRTFDLQSESPRARSKCFERATRSGYNIVEQVDGPVLTYGWNSGVRIIIADEQAFRDMNGNGALDPFEDWRLTPQQRAEDLLRRSGQETLFELPLEGSPEALFREGTADNPYREAL